MYYVIGVSAPSLHRESTDSLIHHVIMLNFDEVDINLSLPWQHTVYQYLPMHIQYM